MTSIIPVFSEAGDDYPIGYATVDENGQMVINFTAMAAAVLQGQVQIDNLKEIYLQYEFIKLPGDIAKEKIDLIHELHARGYSDSFIARRVGYEEVSVRAFIKAKENKEAREMRGR